VGESVLALDHRFTVTDLDGRRIARVRLSPDRPTPQTDEPPTEEEQARLAQ